MSIGIIAGQGFHSDTPDFFDKMIMNFPLYFITKYTLLLGWIKLAKDLQNPYGDDIYDLNLPYILDYEIWKASHMLSQTSPYNDLASNDNPQPSLTPNNLKNEDVI